MRSRLRRSAIDKYSSVSARFFSRRSEKALDIKFMNENDKSWKWTGYWVHEWKHQSWVPRPAAGWFFLGSKSKGKLIKILIFQSEITTTNPIHDWLHWNTLNRCRVGWKKIWPQICLLSFSFINLISTYPLSILFCARALFFTGQSATEEYLSIADRLMPLAKKNTH